MSEPIIIGVDHGYAAMKTAHFSFHTGLVAHEHEPYTLNNVLEYLFLCCFLFSCHWLMLSFWQM